MELNYGIEFDLIKLFIVVTIQPLDPTRSTVQRYNSLWIYFVSQSLKEQFQLVFFGFIDEP